MPHFKFQFIINKMQCSLFPTSHLFLTALLVFFLFVYFIYIYFPHLLLKCQKIHNKTKKLKCVMSDSDTNTDVLLLIPPDFFLVDSSDNESADALISFRSNTGSFLAPKQPMYTNSNSSELQSINARLSTIENCFATGSSDITSISTSTTVKPRNYLNFLNEMDHKSMESPSKLNHSTPKYSRRLSSEYNSPNPKMEGNVLKDIDRFLLDNKRSVENPINSGSVRDFDLANKALMKHNFMMETNKNRDDEPLLSLNEMWGPGGQCNENFSVQEERLRREHCEKSIQVLQSKCLEYQQKISVALKIDRTKDDALTKLHENNTRLAVIIQQHEDETLKLKNQFETEKIQMKDEFREIKQKNQILENEISQAIEMAKKFQEKNEVLELKTDNLKSSSGEIQDIHKKQIADLEIRLSNSLQNENLFSTEVSKLKYQTQDLMEEVSKNSFCKRKLEETESQLSSFKQYKEILDEKLNRLEFLEKSKRSDQQIIENLLGKEKSLVKELENQRANLKSYYQAQLEQVVSHKLKEFQEQLDSVEETLKSDAKIRERTIAERAIKQMELINQK